MGVAYCLQYPDSYSFVFSNGHQTRVDDCAIDEKAWIVKKIDNNDLIGKVKIMFDKTDSRLLGIKFYDMTSKSEILAVGPINLRNYREHPGIRTQVIELLDHERIVGVKSGSRGDSWSEHFDLQFVIGKPKHKSLFI